MRASSQRRITSKLSGVRGCAFSWGSIPSIEIGQSQAAPRLQTYSNMSGCIPIVVESGSLISNPTEVDGSEILRNVFSFRSLIFPDSLFEIFGQKHIESISSRENMPTKVRFNCAFRKQKAMALDNYRQFAVILKQCTNTAG